jgi:hypothetical protein
LMINRLPKADRIRGFGYTGMCNQRHLPSWEWGFGKAELLLSESA